MQTSFNETVLPRSSKKDLLLGWMKTVSIFKTSDVIEWGRANFYNRASRTARDLASDGYIRRLTDAEQYTVFGKIGEKVWIIK